jgi:ATP-dependent DNA helicase RecG
LNRFYSTSTAIKTPKVVLNSELKKYRMKDIAIDFDTLKETHDIECKAALGRDGQGELPKDFWESYSAMANTDGGSIFLGVVEQDYTFTPLGIQNSDKVIKDLVAIANSREKVSVNLLGNADIVPHSFGATTVIESKVRRASRKERPVYLKKTPIGNSYRRGHEADQRMSDDEVKRMLADQQYDSLDHRVLKGFDLKDLDKQSLADFRQSVAVRSPGSNFDALSNLAFMKQIGGWKKDRESGEEGLTVAGLLMFGSYQSIRDEFAHYFVDDPRKSSQNPEDSDQS